MWHSFVSTYVFAVKQVKHKSMATATEFLPALGLNLNVYFIQLFVNFKHVVEKISTEFYRLKQKTIIKKLRLSTSMYMYSMYMHDYVCIVCICVVKMV